MDFLVVTQTDWSKEDPNNKLDINNLIYEDLDPPKFILKKKGAEFSANGNLKKFRKLNNCLILNSSISYCIENMEYLKYKN